MPTPSSATAESSGSNVPAFLSKLWRLVEDPKYDSIISWSDSGQSFTIHDQTQFSKEVLPLYFKHNNMASFIRQLNMYGFRKVVNVDSGGLKGYKEDIEFYHNFFNRGQEATLEFIKRKAPGHQKGHTTTATAGPPVPHHDNELRTELVRELLTDVNQLQGKQEKVDSQLVEMKRENEALWREVAVLRRKHLKQQQIVEKLIQFLASLVHQARAGKADNNISMKRKLTLMIDEEGNVRKTLRGPIPQPRQASEPETRMSEIDSGPIISDITYEQSSNKQGFVNRLGSKESGLKIVASCVPMSQMSECVINSPETATDLTDEVVLCENLFDEEVDLAPNVDAEISPKSSYQPQVQSPQQPALQEHQMHLQEIDKFDLEQSLNTPQVEVWEEEEVAPGPSVKMSARRFQTPSTTTDENSGMQLALQTPVRSTLKDETPLSKNKAVTDWPGDRHVTLAQKLNTILSDFHIGAEKIKRMAEETNRPTEELHGHLEGVETELDWLQDQLLAGGLNIDSNTLINIFNNDIDNLANDTSGSNADSQVVSYQNPSFLDLISDADEEENILQLQAK